MHSNTAIVALLCAWVCVMFYAHYRKRGFIAILFTILGAWLAVVAAYRFNLVAPIVPYWLVYLCYLLIMFSYLVIKQGLYHWVNGLFFSKAQCERWRNRYAHILVVETALLFPVTLSLSFQWIDTVWSLQIALVVLLFVNLWLLLEGFKVFFRKKYGYLLVFPYFCALEGVAFTALCALMIEITHTLIHIL